MILALLCHDGILAANQTAPCVSQWLARKSYASKTQDVPAALAFSWLVAYNGVGNLVVL